MSKPKWKQNGEWSAFQPPGETSAVVKIVYQGERGRRHTQFLATCNSTLADNLANATLFATASELYDACSFVKSFLTKLEMGTEPGDPLRLIRRKFHAPLHAVLDAAMAKARGEA